MMSQIVNATTAMAPATAAPKWSPPAATAVPATAGACCGWWPRWRSRRTPDWSAREELLDRSPDAVVSVRRRDPRRCVTHGGLGLSHGHARPGDLEHLDVGFRVSDGDDLEGVDADVFARHA